MEKYLNKLAIFLFLLFHQTISIDYFDQQAIGAGGKQMTSLTEQQQRSQKQSLQPSLQTPHQQPSIGYGDSQYHQQQQKEQQKNPYGFPQQQQAGQGISSIPLGRGIQQRQNEPFEFGRGLQLQQQQMNSSLLGNNPNAQINDDGNVQVEVC
jgi:hypothetical protein